MTDRLTHSAELCLINQSDALSKIDKLQKHRVQKVTQFRPFDGQAEEAAQFYVSLVPDSRIDRVMRSPIDTSARDKRRGEKWSRLTLLRWNRRPMGDSYLLNMNSRAF